MFISIDDFYPVSFYNQCREALKNNNIPFKEYISIVGSNKWFLEVPRAPIMLNYTVCPQSEERYLISKVQALEPTFEYRYYRRESRFNPIYTRNDAWGSTLEKEAWLVNIISSEWIRGLSRLDPLSKIWYLGRYWGNKYKLAIITSPIMRAIIPRENILLSKAKSESPEVFEANINYRVLRGFDRIEKFSSTPYFLNGLFKTPQYYPEELKTRFFIF